MTQPPFPLLIALTLAVPLMRAGEKERVMESVVPSIESGQMCTSTLNLQNLGDTPEAVEVDSHSGSGALIPLEGSVSNTIHLEPGERHSYRLQVAEETDAWVRVRERIPATRLAPVVAVSGTAECVKGNELHSAGREAAYPMRNPWFAGEVKDIDTAILLLVNTSEHAVTASACYSSGGLYSVRGETFKPICTNTLDVLVPPFGTRRFPVQRDGNSYFSLRTAGAAIVLQMLRPPTENSRMFKVDSSIKFGSEVAEPSN